MPRYTLVDYESASPEVRAIYDDFLRQTGSTTVPYWVQSLGCNVSLLHAYWERTKGSLVRGVMPAILKEMVIFVVSVENGSRYCSACHAHAVLGLDPTLKFEDLNALLDTEDRRLALPPSYRAALDFAIRMARDPNAVSDADFESLREADFDDAEIRELLAVIDLAAMFNQYTSALRLPLDPGYRPVLAPLPA
ncbi:MAG: carboxymuconolactone decarboxylase family protein [Burkholderiales bacterium]|nr:carboxymuconolactone decarboxylase family protein [Burkholderiales bacterium]MDE1925947.1 carboxymuconolactone decarboxylase family protein [Burkholderiales bacterium]MDE2159810.1 carboxymuconolactone decarboxylase family protein [Burkholderiales bacterium]MDE2503493.1 carboxymuconolactone decarboxylase family protein [Burkholderiales bacterium]